MTTEQKAKAYDEALRKARKIYNKILNNEILGFPDQLREMFPELKESEDERIRKALIAFLKENHETGRAEETWSLSGIERWIAWLEKQKEPVNVSVSTMIPSCWEEKQKEQKPVDLVKEEYIENRNNGTFTFDNTEKESAHNELTIEDIKELDRIHLEIESEMGFEESDAFYQEVLKRFKKYKYGNAKEDTDINGTEG